MPQRSNCGPNEMRLSIQDCSGLDLEGKTMSVKLFELLNPTLKKVMIIVFFLSLYLDPIVFYIWNINDKIKCIHTNKGLRGSFLLSRSAVDVFYFADFFFRVTGTVNTKKTSRFSLAAIFPFIFNALPLVFPFPQVLVMLAKFDLTYQISISRFVFYFFFISYWGIQYQRRFRYIYGLIPSFKDEGSPDVISQILKAYLDFSPFSFFSHWLGSFWYYLAIKRETICWLNATQNVRGHLFCTSATRVNDTGLINRLCNPSDDSDPSSLLEFGIYHDAITLGVTRTKNLKLRLVQCFWWSLRNLSSFGSNMETSTDVLDVIFKIVMCVCGITLFTVYLGGQMQLAGNVSEKFKFNKKRKMVTPDIDLWFSKNTDVPKNMKKVIMKTVRDRLEEKQDVNVENIVSILSPLHKRLIMRPLCLDLLKTVPMLKETEDQVLKAISEHFNWELYSADGFIIREGEPLRKMFVIRQGTALTYTTRKNDTFAASESDNLEKGDRYGEELIKWAFSFGTYSNMPISTRTVVCLEKVEVFVISASDLKKIVSMFWWQFSRKLQLNDIENSLLMQLRILATSSLRRRGEAMARRGTGWDQVLRKLSKLKKNESRD